MKTRLEQPATASTAPKATTPIAIDLTISAMYSVHPPNDCAIARAYCGARTMQRKPRWHVDVSIGCAIRAAGR